ncbi:acyl-CoA carboxylase subunit beta [Aquisalimonas sp. APHAB1-3]|uniref:acyl-CoA carboxylase subunit beta n=1 Tax=Aquisalimonas sp. APHAB1-3 TaxID=3402080 RepID=UPI003AAC7757
MSWQDDLDELARRQELAYRMGGPEKVERQHRNGKQTVRERIDALLDAGSFREIGSIAGAASYDDNHAMTDFVPANQVAGHGRLDGQAVAVVGDDFTVRGGASDASVAAKLMHPERMAHAMRMPLIRLVDGTGGGGSVKKLEETGFTYVPAVPGWEQVDRNLSEIPVIALALGSVAGLGAARVAASHYSVMVRETAQLFAAGPPLVAHIGQNVDKEELGGSAIHARNGTVDDEVGSEQEALDCSRRFLSYLPPSIDELPPRVECNDPVGRADDRLLSAVPREERRVYAIRPIIQSVVDQDSFFEIGRLWGRSAVTGLARLDGWPVAVIASDPYIYGGCWTRSACEKITRFVDLADTFRLPVVHLVDIPGFQIGVEAEQAATIRAGVRAMSAIGQCSIPWCSIILRKCFGVAGAAHRPEGRFSMRYAWPSAQWGSLPVAGGLEAAYKADLEQAEDPEARRAEIAASLDAVASPFRTAEKFGIEEIIDPRETRRLLCEFATLAAPARARRDAPVNRYRP